MLQDESIDKEILEVENREPLEINYEAGKDLGKNVILGLQANR